MSEPKKIKQAAKFLLDNGLLFEINRRILHPVGLALEVEVNDRGQAVFEGLWDCREDPEGIIYDEEVLEDGLEKYNKFMKEHGDHRLETRKEQLGYIEQVKK